MESVSDEHKQTDPSVQAVDHASAGHRKKIYRVAGVAFSQHQTLTIICCASSTTIILNWIQSDSIRHGQHSGRWDWIFKKILTTWAAGELRVKKAVKIEHFWCNKSAFQKGFWI